MQTVTVPELDMKSCGHVTEQDNEHSEGKVAKVWDQSMSPQTNSCA